MTTILGGGGGGGGATVMMTARSAQQAMENNKTATIYSFIRDGKLADAIRVLTQELNGRPNSRAALSLLGYCYYHKQEFDEAGRVYGQLVGFYPDVQEYKLYHAQALYRAGMYQEAAKAATQVDDPQYAYRTLHLQAAIKYEQDELNATKGLVDRCLPDDPDTVIARGCILFKEGNFEEALNAFADAMGALGYQSDLAYNSALCYYKMEMYGPALKHIAEIIERGVQEHPELSVASSTADGVLVRSVGNSQTLKETALVEAFNLKAAIEYRLENYEAAQEALADMPPREEEELDPVTLHNQALMHMETDPTGGFKKLNYLIQQPAFPPEAFGNLLLLYAKYQYYDLAADVLADNTHLHSTCLSQELYEYLEATILAQSSPEEAYQRFDTLSKKHTDNLRLLTKQIQDARRARDESKVTLGLQEYDLALDKFIPVLMAQAKIYWDLGNCEMVERIFRQSSEICSGHDVWRLNVAHTFFMQDKYRQAIQYYEPIVKAQMDRILDVTAIVLANLCVSYIMTSENEDAEELMRQIEKEEERMAYEEPDKQVFHLCIVNLVIGTLYCAKGNYEFGISRIIKSLEPYDRKLGPDTWYYAKRCVLALLENLSKHILVCPDNFYQEVLEFLDNAEENGSGIQTLLEAQGQEVDPAQHNVAFEAKVIKKILLQLLE